VLDFKAPTSQRAILELEKPKVRGKLHKIALVRTTSHAPAEDLVQSALLRVLDPEDAPWDPSQGSFVRHMKLVIRQTWGRQVRRASVQREVRDGGVKAEEGTASKGDLADEEVEHLRWLRQRASLLDEVVTTLEAEHPLVRPICELGAQGIESPAEQAQKLGCSVQTVYDAFATLKRYARKALTDWDRAERRRIMMAEGAATTPATDTPEDKEANT
jgi:DNA-directed RNA polymerase specialized sigma24 family protein